MDPPLKARAVGQWESCGPGLLIRLIYLAIDLSFKKEKKKLKSLIEFVFFNKPKCWLFTETWANYSGIKFTKFCFVVVVFFLCFMINILMFIR